MVALLIVGTTIGLIWADTSNVAGAFAGVTNVISLVGIVLLLIALGVVLASAAGGLGREQIGSRPRERLTRSGLFGLCYS